MGWGSGVETGVKMLSVAKLERVAERMPVPDNPPHPWPEPQLFVCDRCACRVFGRPCTVPLAVEAGDVFCVFGRLCTWRCALAYDRCIEQVYTMWRAREAPLFHALWLRIYGTASVPLDSGCQPVDTLPCVMDAIALHITVAGNADPVLWCGRADELRRLVSSPPPPSPAPVPHGASASALRQPKSRSKNKCNRGGERTEGSAGAEFADMLSCLLEQGVCGRRRANAGARAFPSVTKSDIDAQTLLGQRVRSGLRKPRCRNHERGGEGRKQWQTRKHPTIAPPILCAEAEEGCSGTMGGGEGSGTAALFAFRVFAPR